MRIAFLLVGQLRTFEYTLPSILQQLAYYRNSSGVTCVDVFCHTWTKSGVNAGWKAAAEQIHGTIDEVRELLITRLQPTAVQVDEYVEATYVPNADMLQRFQNPDDEWYGWRGSRTIGMYYSLYACNQLRVQHEKTHGFEYDVVIKSRYDI